jgi:hypothetical protein
MAVITQSQPGTSPGSLLRISGAFIAIFSLAMGSLVLFVIPGACSFVGSIQVLMLGMLFVFGLITFLVGTAISRKGMKR